MRLMVPKGDEGSPLNDGVASLFKVKRLSQDPSLSAWNRLLPPTAPAQQLEDNITADWLVIGANGVMRWTERNAEGEL